MAEGSPESEKDPQEAGPAADPAADGAKAKGESRRSFIKKLPYIAPVIETFLLSETAYGSSDDSSGKSGGKGGRRGVSPPPPGSSDDSS